jgi:hypothetical protein
MKKLVIAILLASLVHGNVSHAVEAKKVEKIPKEPSRYIQCDGQPNNTTAAESAARILGAFTLLVLLAPKPEMPDPKARKFGLEGIKSCSSLLEGVENIESNPVRRLELQLARAVHYIEAKDYAAAVTDVRKARVDAESRGLFNDVYF